MADIFLVNRVTIIMLYCSIALRFNCQAIAETPWYEPNTVIRRDLQTPTVKEEIRRYSSQYRFAQAHKQTA
jgi:hypothetical protein